MQKFSGKLLYTGWLNQWKLITNDGEIDLWPTIDKFFVSLNGKRANHEQGRDSYTLSADDSSEFQFEYIPGEYVLLEKPEGFDMSNVHSHLDITLGWLSGRLVEIDIEDGKRIKFSADASEKVFGVYFVGDGNSCEVPRGAENTVCKVGHYDCCVFLFLSAGADGFKCEKFNSPMARVLLDRLANRTMRANRIGNCALLGRK
ncbi:MAG: hypothetical protein HYT28_00725 [Parcubacteria group bacterium]|nr:hypothetical protein [Parcubacteria group bacterium]